MSNRRTQPQAVDPVQSETSIDYFFSRWTAIVENYLKDLFVSDKTIDDLCRSRYVIKRSIRVHQTTDREQSDVVKLALQAAVAADRGEGLDDFDRAQIAEVTAQWRRNRKRAAEALGRPELVSWMDHPADVPPEGSATDGLSRYWRHVVHCGDQLATLGLIEPRMRHRGIKPA